jgi:hypothetical protein
MDAKTIALTLRTIITAIATTEERAFQENLAAVGVLKGLGVDSPTREQRQLTLALAQYNQGNAGDVAGKGMEYARMVLQKAIGLKSGALSA